MCKLYYEAYDDRYRQVHAQNLQWSSDAPSAIVEAVLTRYGTCGPVLELGCGEGRDAIALLSKGYSVLATDLSEEAVTYCRRKFPEYADRFQVLDCIKDSVKMKFDFIYAVAVVHMLLEDRHRAGFYDFFRQHLSEQGIGLICTMGDGTVEVQSDPTTAFQLQEREHGETGRKLRIAGTSCRMVSTETFAREIRDSGLAILEQGTTAVPPDFPVMLYAVVKCP